MLGNRREGEIVVNGYNTWRPNFAARKSVGFVMNERLLSGNDFRTNIDPGSDGCGPAAS